jgi:hypothetical protein
MSNQPVISFTILPTRTPTFPPRQEPSLKQARAPTTSTTRPILPPYYRKKLPPLKSTNTFIFTGLHPLYNREVIEGQYNMITISCS